MICFRIEMHRETLSSVSFMLLKPWKSAALPPAIPAVSGHLPAETRVRRTQACSAGLSSPSALLKQPPSRELNQKQDSVGR